MNPWWDSSLLWSGVGIVGGAIVAALVAIIIIARISARQHPRA